MGDPGNVAARPVETRDETGIDRSMPVMKTIGIVAVAALAASAVLVPQPPRLWRLNGAGSVLAEGNSGRF
jgi:hypothetical protein